MARLTALIKQNENIQFSHSVETNHSHQNILLNSEQTRWAVQAAAILDIEVMEMLSQLLKSNLEALGENSIYSKLPENDRKMV